MEKNVQIELELSEEQQQEITGGCATCIANVNQSIHHLSLVKGYSTIASNAIARGKNPTLYQTLAQGHINAATTLMSKVADRGHID